MKGIGKGLLLGAGLVLLVGQAAFATSTDALRLISGTSTATIADNGTCTNTVGTPCSTLTGDSDGGITGQTTVSGTINGWKITVVAGVTNSPSLTPVGLDLASLTAVCSTGSCGDLLVEYSDINFNVAVPAGGFTTTYSSTQAGTGSTLQKAWFDNGNTLFTQTTLIGTVGPFTSSNVGHASGGAIASDSSYSLTLAQFFSGGTNGTQYSVDGNITAVPEPVSVSLLGGVLLVTVGAIRRKMRRA
jgi:hypothetical protein